MNYWLNWAVAAGIRAVKTFFQTFAGFLVVGAAVSDIQWEMALSVSAVAAVGSLATSLAGLPEVKKFKEVDDPMDLEDGE